MLSLLFALSSHLDMNKISSVHEDAFNGLTSLTTLYLQNNNISVITSQTFSSRNKLTSLWVLTAAYSYYFC